MLVRGVPRGLRPGRQRALEALAVNRVWITPRFRGRRRFVPNRILSSRFRPPTFRSAIGAAFSVCPARNVWRWFSTAIAVIAAVPWILIAPAVRADTVDLELVFASDGSGSIDDDELRLQREGYATAFSDPKVLNEIAAGTHGRIAIA